MSEGNEENVQTQIPLLLQITKAEGKVLEGNLEMDSTEAVVKSEENMKIANGIDMDKKIGSHKDLKCGIPFFQSLANQSTFIIIYGLVGCIISMTYAYFNGTITTLEKRFHMSSRSIGISQIGCDITQMITSTCFIYFVGKKHRPRWMGIGILFLFLFCLLITTPHWFYGAGEDALRLTKEFADSIDKNSSLTSTTVMGSKNLCNLNATIDECEVKRNEEEKGGVGNEHTRLILFLAQSVSGMGYSLYYNLGYSYMDDNVEKSKTASMYSFSFFLNMLGPSAGYTLAAFCLRFYIAPALSPTINNSDPRWVGAWWMGWLIFAVLFLLSGFLLSMFPKELPSTFQRRMRKALRGKEIEDLANEKKALEEEKEALKMEEASVEDLIKTFRRIVKNKTYMANNFSTVFYFFGYMPYWIFTPKYLEITFRQSAAESNVYTGTVALAFTALGVLVSGIIISRKKPRARYLSAWNATVGFLTVIGLISYSFIGCPGNEDNIFLENSNNLGLNDSLPHCAKSCHCDYVPYAPVCGENNMTYISACHAGCKSQHSVDGSGKKIFYDCDCIPDWGHGNVTLQGKEFSGRPQMGGRATPGACPFDCFNHFLIFLAIKCSLKFIGATTRASCFLIQVRCIAADDKAVAMALGMVLMALLSYIPSPIFFGWIMDRTCLVWGKTCTEKGNCWLYDAKKLRLTLNYTAAFFVAIGALFDCTVCYLVKDLRIYDDEEKKIAEDKSNDDNQVAEKKMEKFEN